jgi:choline dehydrogenase-like flavoprotein
MLDDADDVPTSATIPCDVCIVGAGAAGITMARSLAGTRHRVVVLESGGLDFEDRVQRLEQGSVSGLEYDVESSRLRYFGGSTNHWAGMSRPLDPEDFEIRDWIAHSGWPFARTDLDPYYANAQRICDLGPFRYDLEWWLKRLSGVRPLIDNDTIRTALFQIGPGTRFGEKYRSELRRATNVQVLLHANAVNVRSDEARVRGVDVATLAGNRFAVDAGIVVLALGGLESPRLLLASQDTNPAGLGNDRDLVGRFFMDHPHVVLGRLVLADRAPDPELSFFVGVPFARAGLLAMEPPRTLLGALAFTPRVARALGLQGWSATLFPIEGDDERDSGTVRDAGSAQVSDAAIDALVGDIEGRSAVPRPTHEVETLSGGRTEVSNEFALFVRSEQTPNPESRVTLTSETDELGVPRLDLHWALTDDDWSQMRRGVDVLAREVGRMGLGRVQRDPGMPTEVGYGSHHSGTTRMHDDPAQGVVDADGQVHGVENLFVAGSSVFPTGGFANPTLTIVALALRLADRVKVLLAG